MTVTTNDSDTGTNKRSAPVSGAAHPNARSVAQRRRRRREAGPPWWPELAERLARSEPLSEAARALGRSRSAVHRAVTDPRFAGLLEREEARQRSEAERLLAMSRPDAVRALRAVVESAVKDPASVPAAEARAAAVELLRASQPPSERQRLLARRELLQALPARLRREVVAALDAGASSYLAGLSDAELDELLGSDEA